jgi:hypothetical protein
LKAYFEAIDSAGRGGSRAAAVSFGQAQWPRTGAPGAPATAIPVWLVTHGRGWAIVDASGARLIDGDAGLHPDAPTMGLSTSPFQTGYGRPAPPSLYTGGDGTSWAAEIRWESWGGTKAVGHGTAAYLGPDARSSADAKSEPATIVAFDLGTCRGRRGYRAVNWYFPQHGESFDPTWHFDACEGEWGGR